MPGAGDMYRCSVCGWEGVTTRSDEEAKAEAATLFGGPVPDEETEILCHDCYIKFVEWFDGLTPAEHEEIAARVYPKDQLFEARRHRELGRS